METVEAVTPVPQVAERQYGQGIVVTYPLWAWRGLLVRILVSTPLPT